MRFARLLAPRLAPRSARLAGFLLAVLLASGGTARAQCAMCEGSAAAGADRGAAYNRSTLFMLAVPYLLLGGIGGYVAWSFRKPRTAQPPADGDPVDPDPH
jgi:hypothetical protein